MTFRFKTGLKIGICAFLLYLAVFYWGYISKFLMGVLTAAAPLVAGCIVAYLVNLLMAFYERHYFPKSKAKFVEKSRRVICMILAFITLLGIISLIVGLIVPQLIDCIKLFIEALPDAMEYFTKKLSSFEHMPKNVLEVLNTVDWQSKIDQLFDFVSTGMGGVMSMLVKTLTSVVSGIVGAFISIIFSVYLLLSKEKLAAQFDTLMVHYLKDGVRAKIHYVLHIFDDCFHRFIVGQCTEAVILGVLCILGMLILGLPYPTMISALIAFTSLIPVAGPYIGSGIGAFLILSVEPVDALIFLIFMVILQQFEGNVIYPRVVGESLRLPSIWVLAAVVIGSGIMGVSGLLLGVPLTAVIYRIITDDVKKRKSAKLKQGE